jgi:hypothetical protein
MFLYVNVAPCFRPVSNGNEETGREAASFINVPLDFKEMFLLRNFLPWLQNTSLDLNSNNPTWTL